MGRGLAIIRGVSKSDDSAVRFACPRCFKRLKAPLAQVGTKRRCPQCHFVFEVPTAAQAARRRRDVGEYRVSEGTAPSPRVDEPHVTAICPVCGTLMHPGIDEVGHEVACPECDTSVVVPPPAPQEKRRPPDVPLEAYSFWEEGDGSGVGPRPADQTYVPVTCPVCETFLQVTEDQVGREIVCPDCRLPMVVPPPVKREETKGRPVADPGEYPLCEEDDWRSDARPEAQLSYPVRCPLCDTLIQATADQAGQTVVCRDCETSFVVPPRPPPRRKRDLRAEAGEVYGVGDAIEPLKYEPMIVFDRTRPRPGAQSAADRDRGGPLGRTRPPRWTFFSGIFSFPAYRNSWPRWLGLSLGLIVPLWVGWCAVALALSPAGPWIEALPWILAMVLGATAFVLGIVWATVAFANLLCILRDTAYGHDEVENWPEPVFVDWLIDSFFVLSSLGVAALIGLAFAQGLGYFIGPGASLLLPASLLIAFPVVLLSTLETNFPLNPFSWPVWRSLLSGWWAWGLFYVETTTLIVAAGGLALVAAYYVPILGPAPAAPVLVAVLMIYFRLLGRLAWRCGEGAARAKPRPTEEASSDDDEGDR